MSKISSVSSEVLEDFMLQIYELLKKALTIWNRGEIIIPATVLLISLFFRLELLLIIVSTCSVTLDIFSAELGEYRKSLNSEQRKFVTLENTIKMIIVYSGVEFMFNFVGIVVTDLIDQLTAPDRYRFSETGIGDTYSFVYGDWGAIYNTEWIEGLLPIIIFIGVVVLLINYFPFERFYLPKNTPAGHTGEESTFNRMKSIIVLWVVLMSFLGEFFVLFSLLLFQVFRKSKFFGMQKDDSFTSHVIRKIQEFPEDQQALASVGILITLSVFIIRPFALDNPLSFLENDPMMSLEMVFWFTLIFLVFLLNVKTEYHFINFVLSYVLSVLIAIRGVFYYFSFFSNENLLYNSDQGLKSLAVFTMFFFCVLFYYLLNTAVVENFGRGLRELSKTRSILKILNNRLVFVVLVFIWEMLAIVVCFPFTITLLQEMIV